MTQMVGMLLIIRLLCDTSDNLNIVTLTRLRVPVSTQSRERVFEFT